MSDIRFVLYAIYTQSKGVTSLGLNVLLYKIIFHVYFKFCSNEADLPIQKFKYIYIFVQLLFKIILQPLKNNNNANLQ